MIPLLSDFFYVFVLLAFYVRLVNPIFFMFINWDWIYYLNIMHCIFLFQLIYKYIYISFLIIFPFLITLVFGTCGLRYSIPPIHLDFVSLRRYHFLPLFFIAIQTLRTMFSLVGGRVEKGSFCTNAKLFW